MDPLESSPGLLKTLRKLSTTVLAILQNRLELVAVELQEERARLFNALLLTAIMVGVGFLGVALATLALVIFLWQLFGIAGLLIVSAVDLLIALVIYYRLRQQLKNWSFLSGTLDELKKDYECLRNKN